MNISRPFLIFSVYKAELSERENMDRHAKILDQLDKANIRYVETLGSYYGDIEQGVMIDYSHENVVRELTAMADQESYLHVDANRNATLHRPSGEFLLGLGAWVEISEGVSTGTDSWTRMDGRYFTTFK